MKNHILKSTRGFVPVVIVYILGAAGVGWMGYKVVTFDPGKTTEFKKVAAQMDQATKDVKTAQEKVTQASEKVDAATTKITTEKDTRLKAGQKLVADTQEALATAPAAIRADLHVKAAEETIRDAAKELETVLGSLTSEQRAEVQQLVAKLTSENETIRADAERELQQVRTERDQSVQRQIDAEKARSVALEQKSQAEKQLTAAQTEQGKAEAKLQDAAQSRDGFAMAFARFKNWVFIAVIVYVIVVFILPMLGTVFPAVAPFANAVHAIFSPIMAKMKGDAENLARDASAATQEVLNKVQEKAPGLIDEAKAKAAEWITEADGTRARFDKKLREAHQL